MNFLNKIKIDKQTINLIKENNSEEILEDLNMCESDAIKIYELLKNKGIKDLNEILINYIDIFFMDEKYLNDILSNNVVNDINEGIINIMQVVYEK